MLQQKLKNYLFSSKELKNVARVQLVLRWQAGRPPQTATSTTSKGQTKVDVEETKHGRGKKGTRTDDGVEPRPRSAKNIMDFPRDLREITARNRKLSDVKPRGIKSAPF